MVWREQRTTGLLKFSLPSLNFFNASFSLLAPWMTELILLVPTYSRIDRSWSVVGAASVMSKSNSGRLGSVWWEWSLAWSSVADSEALAETCLRRLTTLVEAGELALWKTVIMSFGLCCSMC